MDIDALTKGMALINTTLTTLKSIIAALPDNAKKTSAQAGLEQAEREFKIAEATAAKGLGYEICRNHFPPETMLSPDGGIWECPNCHSKRDTTIHIHGNPMDNYKNIL
jgi:hypothetical protein